VHERLREALVRFERAGLPCEVVAGAGTGAPAADLAARVFSELQPAAR